MKQVFVRNYIFSIWLLMFSMVMYAELLIVKKDDFGYVALSEVESLQYNDQISEILQKYQWPMCLGSDLTEDEKNELLTADTPYAEELFIQKKLQKALPKLNLQLVFIPTSLYELFCLSKICNGDTLSMKNISMGSSTLYFNPLLQRQDLSPEQVRMKIQNTFKEVNEAFFKKQKFGGINYIGIYKSVKPSMSLLVNHEMFVFLNNLLPEISFCKNAKEISDIIQKNNSKLCLALLKNLELTKDQCDFSNKKCLLESEKESSSNYIIPHVVALEYEARKQNKALLLRGSGLMEMNVTINQNPLYKSLIGTTLYKEIDWFYGSGEIPFWKKYKEKNNKPYSISFGISLFAGIINDPGACAYVFLSRCNLFDQTITDKSSVKLAGYGLLVNKKDYVQHQNNNLFYIPSLATIPSLFAQGEWFHARAKAAIHQSKRENVYVQGVLHESFWDPTGVLLITRDPLKHAELFSNFLVQNGRLIQPGNTSLLTDAEKVFAQDVMKAQADIAELYKAVKTVTPKIEKATKTFKEKRDKKFFDWMHDFQDL